MFKSCKQTAVIGAAFLCLAACVYDVMNEAGTFGTNVYCFMNQAFFCSPLAKSELTWLRNAEPKLDEKRLVSWCFEPSQPQRIITGVRETFIKRYIAERTNKAEIRPEEQNGKAERCRENLWNEIRLTGP